MAKNISESGVYEITVNNLKKEVQILVEGSMMPTQAEEFIAEYKKTVGPLEAKNLILRLDCRDLKLVTPELEPSLSFCYDMYKSSGFKQVIFEIIEAPYLKMQLGRLARKAKLTNAEVVIVG